MKEFTKLLIRPGWESKYPKATLTQWRQKRNVTDDDLLSDYIDIRLIAERTRAVSPLVIYPFIAISLMMLARINYFDYSGWPVGVIFFYTCLLLFAVVAALNLYRAAEDARETAAKKLRNKHMHLKASGSRKLAQIAHDTMEDIEHQHEGAFAPLWRNPLIASLLLPSGSLSIWVLFQHFSNLR